MSKRKRIYVDSSVVYGAPAREFSQDSKRFWDTVRRDGIIIVASDVLDVEMKRAPRYIQDLFNRLPEPQVESIPSTQINITGANRIHR